MIRRINEVYTVRTDLKQNVDYYNLDNIGLNDCAGEMLDLMGKKVIVKYIHNNQFIVVPFDDYEYPMRLRGLRWTDLMFEEGLLASQVYEIID